MRKNNFKSHCMSIGWAILHFLPLIVFLLCMVFHIFNFQRANAIFDITDMINDTFMSVCNTFLNQTMAQSPLSMVFCQLTEFIVGVVRPSNGFALVIVQVCWYIWVFLFRLAFDFILFIPRLAHKWLHSAYKGDDYE